MKSLYIWIYNDYEFSRSKERYDSWFRKSTLNPGGGGFYTGHVIVKMYSIKKKEKIKLGITRQRLVQSNNSDKILWRQASIQH